MNRKLNKKGFTLTELIVVIVIIGILAVVLIPTLTGYIKKAKNTAATEEASSYITAYNTWVVETSGELQDLNSFRDYCVELGMVEEKEAVYTILTLDVATKSFVVKASNGLYVKYYGDKDGILEVFEEMPVDELKNSFFESVVKPNLAYINKDLLEDVAQLKYASTNEDGSVNIEIKIIDGSKTALEVVGAVQEIIQIINEAGGKTAIAYPVIENMTLESYFNTTNVEEFYVEISDLHSLGMQIAAALSYEEGIDATEWSDQMNYILSNCTIDELVDMNLVKVIANIQPDANDQSTEYKVVYNFDFIK